MGLSTVSQEIQYLILFTAVLIIPKIFLRIGIPAGISAFFIGIGTSFIFKDLKNDQLLSMMSKLGITSLFLFAGLEINFKEFLKEKFLLIPYLLQSLIAIFLISFICMYIFNLNRTIAMVLAIGIMTPSAGFILNSLKNYALTEEEGKLVRLKAISLEIIAIMLLFVILQSDSSKSLLTSSVLLLLLIFSLPVIFKAFLKFIAPYAPDSELPFLILIALISGVITTRIGGYYLIGAFIAGITAAQFKNMLHSIGEQNMVAGLSTFFGFFIPFYFFSAGLKVTTDYFQWSGLLIGLIFAGLFIPLRYTLTFFSLKSFATGFWHDKKNIAMVILPTLIFGLVITSILHEKYHVETKILSGLLVYTIVTSIIPVFFVRKSS